MEDCVNNNRKSLHVRAACHAITQLNGRLARVCDSGRVCGGAQAVVLAGRVNGTLGASQPHQAKVRARWRLVQQRKNGLQLNTAAKDTLPSQGSPPPAEALTKDLGLLGCNNSESCCPSRRYSLEPRDSTEASPRSMGKGEDGIEICPLPTDGSSEDSGSLSLCKTPSPRMSPRVSPRCSPRASPRSPRSPRTREPASPASYEPQSPLPTPPIKDCNAVVNLFPPTKDEPHTLDPPPTNPTSPSSSLGVNQIVVKAEVHDEPKSLPSLCGPLGSYSRQPSDSSSSEAAFPPASKCCAVVQLQKNGVVLPNGSLSAQRGLHTSCLRPPGPSPDTSRSATPSSSSSANDDNRRSGDDSSVTCCWRDCGVRISDGDLKDHILSSHVVAEQEEDKKIYRCRWEGCKVYGCPSSSQVWIQRHILQHAGTKPFRCIVEGCGQRFSSEGALERHVNSHFNTQQPPPVKPQRSREDTPSKTQKKRSKLKRRKSFLSE